MNEDFVVIPDAEGLGTFIRKSQITSIQVFVGEKKGTRTIYIGTSKGEFTTTTRSKTAYRFINSIVGDWYKLDDDRVDDTYVDRWPDAVEVM